MSWKDLVKSYLTNEEPLGDPIEKVYEKTFPLEGAGTFNLKTIRGSVRLTTHDQPQVNVHAVLRSETGDQERLDELRILEHTQPGFVAIEVDYNQIIKIKARDGIFVHFTIAVPRQANLNLDLHKSNYNIDPSSGALHIKVGKASGTVKGIHGPFTLENQKGNFTGNLNGPQPIEIHDQGGNIQLEIKGEPDYRVNGSTQKGLINVSGADIQQSMGEKREIQLSGTLGNGTHPLNLTSKKGNINLLFVG
jgi:hypothetical protein